MNVIYTLQVVTSQINQGKQEKQENPDIISIKKFYIAYTPIYKIWAGMAARDYVKLFTLLLKRIFKERVLGCINISWSVKGKICSNYLWHFFNHSNGNSFFITSQN
jgi:hypothetical protein